VIATKDGQRISIEEAKALAGSWFNLYVVTIS
jgi:hypothetical protein